MTSTTIENEGSFLGNFLDNIWLQFILTTGVTALWLLWIIYEIVLKKAPA